MSSIYEEVRSYYLTTFSEHGEAPRGVDWNGRESQMLRFQQLLKVVDEDKAPWSLNDLGCGYGAILDAVRKKKHCHAYIGYDLVDEMLAAARLRWADCTISIDFINGTEMRPADYSVASGIFNVKGDRKEGDWMEYVLATLKAMHTASKKGFSFNMLTIFSDAPYMKANLYYADPMFFFNYCKRCFSRNVALLHDYDLYEFTMIIKK